MTGEQLYLLLGEADGDLVMKANEPSKRRVAWSKIAGYTAAAACVALVIGVFGALLIPKASISDNSEMSGNANYNGSATMATDQNNAPGAAGESMDLESPSMENDALGGEGSDGYYGGEWIDGIVVEIGEHIVVTPVEESPYYGLAERFILTMDSPSPDEGDMPEDLMVGDRIRILTNGSLIVDSESGTAEVPEVFAIYRYDENE